MLQKTNRLTLVEQVAKQIEELIEQGVWKRDERIPPEPELMEQLEVSRNTLREAIRALTHAGMLQTRQGDGTYVRSTSTFGPALQRRVLKTDALQTLEVRHAFEREAAILAARRRSKEDLDRIRHCLDRCFQAIADKDTEAYVEWDLRFHSSVIMASHNDLLIEMYSNIAEALQEVIESVKSISDQNQYVDLHEQLLQAIDKQDEELAEQSVYRYIQLTQSHF